MRFSLGKVINMTIEQLNPSTSTQPQLTVNSLGTAPPQKKVKL